MKKGLLIGVVLVVVAIGGAAYFGGGALQRSMGGGADLASTQTDLSSIQGDLPSGQDGLPARAAEIRGTVKSIEGNALVVARVKDDPLASMTEEERAARRQQMMKLSFEERMQRRQQEMQGLQTEDVKVTIPVGVTITKVTSGAGQGDAGEAASLDSVRAGANIVIWTDGGKTDNATAEYVRIVGGQ